MTESFLVDPEYKQQTNSSLCSESTQHWMVDIKDESGMRCIPLSARLSVLGSHREADIVLHDAEVSPQHCVLRLTSGGIWVEDTGSKSGTWIGNVRVQLALAGIGTTLRLGRSTVTLIKASKQRESAPEDVQGIVGTSFVMRRVMAQVKRLAKHKGPVLILGESGTGKELIARALHTAGPRASYPFLVLNVAAMPRDLIESELFGHERGAFTGAVSQRIGAFFEADGGTLFLDEIGELPQEAQPKLLRALDGYEIRRIGGTGPGKRVNVRIVAATHIPLEEQVAKGLFRQDLFHRLAMFMLKIPPLRQRQGDIGLIARTFLQEIAAEFGPRELTPAALARLVAYEWTGNVRELRNVLARAADFTNGKHLIDASDIDKALCVRERSKSLTLTPQLAQQLLAQYGNNVSAAARAAGYPRTSFRKVLLSKQHS